MFLSNLESVTLKMSKITFERSDEGESEESEESEESAIKQTKMAG
jgi:hypothetical protein